MFCIGSCGISLYERSYLKIPSIVKCVAKNQKTNYKNFINKKCVISLDEFFKKKQYSNKKNFLKIINNVKKKLIYYFNKKKNKKLPNFK